MFYINCIRQFYIVLLLTEVFSHIRCTLFSDDGEPYADTRALDNEEFKATGELMACSLVQGGPAPTMMSVNVYNYIIHGISSVQGGTWAALVPDISLRESIKKVLVNFKV